MAFTLNIESKGLFNKATSINLNDILKNCGLKYGSNNEFYILNENEMNNNTCVLYNPKKIGRGIFFDASHITDGKITISINMPTTRSEIKDIINVAEDIERQFKKASFYCEEQNKKYNIKGLLELEEELVQISVESLNSFCRNENYTQCILTLALFPWFLEEDKRDFYKNCKDLDDFENAIHELQTIDVYYAKPSLMHNKNDDKNYACYVLTTNCESVFPVNPTDFLNLNQIKIDDGLIRFFDFNENKMFDGIYPYKKFIEYMNDYGVEKFDNTHIKIPGTLTKEEIIKMIKILSDK